MLVRIIFHPMDDISENRSRIEGSCIHAVEADQTTWTFRNNSWIMQFPSTRSAADVIADFEAEGFEIDEFVEIAFRG